MDFATLNSACASPQAVNRASNLNIYFVDRHTDFVDLVSEQFGAMHASVIITAIFLTPVLFPGQ